MYIPLRNKSFYSLLLSIQSPEDIVKTCEKYNYKACGITDINSVSGCVKFFKACKNIKPILGAEISIQEGGTYTLLCKNKQGWQDLLEIISVSNLQENLKETPTIKEEEIFPYIQKGNLLIIDGYNGSRLHKLIIESDKAYELEYDNIAEDYLDKNWFEIICNHVMRFNDDYYLQIFPNDGIDLSRLLSSLILEVDEKTGNQLQIICGNDTFYSERKDSLDQKIVLASKLKTTFNNLPSQIKKHKELDRFLYSSSYYILPPAKSTELQLESITYDEIYNKIEKFDILSSPQIPDFQCPNNISSDEYLTELCRKGWKEILIPQGKVNTPEKQNEYKDRIVEELEVIKNAALSGYFLIVQDFINHFRNKGYVIDIRGSAGGCLVSYLIGISGVDPIEYGLYFSRFYDSSRNSPGNISLPDIDTDFPPSIRDEVIQYIKNKYGEDKVYQMVTFSRMQGRAILKEVLRVNEACSFEEMNVITSKLPEEAKVADQMEEEEEDSLILWALKHRAKDLQDYCWIKDGKLDGQYAKLFEQAIRLEGVLKSQGKHAAGVVVAKNPIKTFCPLVRGTRSSELIAGFEMSDLEAVGGVKLDILGVSALELIYNICKQL